MRQALYRFYDASGALLYVGITMNPTQRWRDHRKDKPWWHEVARITLETYPDRAAVEAAEIGAIRTERPLYNVAHNRPRRSLRSVENGGSFHRRSIDDTSRQFAFPQVTTQKVHSQVREVSVASVEASTFPPIRRAPGSGFVGPTVDPMRPDDFGGLCLLCWQRRRHVGAACFTCFVGAVS